LDVDMRPTRMPRTVAVMITVPKPTARPSRGLSTCDMARRSAPARDRDGLVTSSTDGGLGNAGPGATRSSPPSSAKKTKDGFTVAFSSEAGTAPASPTPADATSSIGSGPGATGDAVAAGAGGAGSFSDGRSSLRRRTRS
jgi:hypothetical protein